MRLPERPLCLGMALGQEAIDRACRHAQPAGRGHTIRKRGPKADRAKIAGEIDSQSEMPHVPGFSSRDPALRYATRASTNGSS